jgi:putative endonuclease
MINHQTETCNWQVYLLECKGGSYYCGATSDFISRLKKHAEGRGAKYTRSFKPTSVICVSCFMTRSKVLKLEHLVKKVERDVKPVFIINSWMQ